MAIISNRLSTIIETACSFGGNGSGNPSLSAATVGKPRLYYLDWLIVLAMMGIFF
ncbi:MAG: hypothetical protein Q8Q07_01995 [Dehalococcoidales bacterium]|nr:hypothetical protein [Dehalococcoidales bacterium]